MTTDNISSDREQIDNLDGRIAELLFHRLEMVASVIAKKRDQGIPVYDPGREEEILQRLTKTYPLLDKSIIERVWGALFEYARGKTMAEISFSIPFVRDAETLERILTSTSNISHMYSGARDLAALGIDEFRRIIEAAKQRGVDFYFTTTKRDGHVGAKVDLDSFSFQKLIVDDLNLLSSISPSVNVYLSTIFGFKTDKDIEKIIKLKEKHPNITDACLHHDAVFDKDLKEKVKKLKDAGINPIILVNESCYQSCPLREAHYNLTDVPHSIDYFQCHCVGYRQQDPRQLINLAGFIHPAQVEAFSRETGVASFKIAGRSKSPEWIEQTVVAYTKLDVPENIMDIIVYTLADGLFYVSSGALSNVRLHRLSRSERNSLAQDMLDKDQIKILSDKSPASHPSRIKRILQWNKIYDEMPPDALPWYGLAFPEEINDYLATLDKSRLMLVPGCGNGNTVDRLRQSGYQNLIGTDISPSAIRNARSRFKGIDFSVMATQDLSDYFQGGSANVFDWLNLHQIDPKNLESYLNSLGSVSNALIIAWICDEGEQRPSYMAQASIVYNHSPEHVERILSGVMTRTTEFKFSFSTNPKAKEERTHHAVGQIYVRT